MNKDCVEIMIARIWQHFEERIPLLEGDDDTAASQPCAATEDMFDDVANGLLTSCDNITPNEVIVFIYICMNLDS